MASSKDQSFLYRILDANVNRLKEALRVLEDLERFRNHSSNSVNLKKIRHTITKNLLRLPKIYQKNLAARDVARDPGAKSLILDKGRKKVQPRDILWMNFQRAKESSRVLEEVLKCIDIKVSSQFQKIRFQIYDLETKCLL